MRGLKSNSIQDHQPLPAQRQTKVKPVLIESWRAKKGKENKNPIRERAKVPPAATARPVGATAGGLPASLGAAPAASHGRRAQRPVAR
eukprot:132030-Chlamydomonas_euryale.AAC.1